MHWWRTTVAGGAAATLVASLAQAAPAAPAVVVFGPDLEDSWETGAVHKVLDGDTLLASIEESNSAFSGTQRIRTIGINAPEVEHDSQPEQCGAWQAEDALKTLLPAGAPVQLRALDPESYDAQRNRMLRSVYAQDTEGNWYDTARQLVSNGHALWFPRAATGTEKTEWAHNLEYRVLADDAEAGARGLWSPDLCGSSPTASVRLGVSWAQNVLGHEKAFVFNDAGAELSVAGWTIRDSALNLYRFPSSARVPAKGAIEVRMTTGADKPAKGVFYADEGPWFDNLPADNEYFEGDAIYLMDAAGSLQTGNLRAAFAYPCNPDSCRDPLAGSLTVATPTSASWQTGQEPPSAPRQVDVEAGPDGGLTISWRAPTSTGNAAGVTDYRVVATPRDGSSPTSTVVGPSKRTLTVTGLPAGRAHDVTVAARNAEGWSAPSPSTGPVTPQTRPKKPREVAAVPLDGSLIARWKQPSSDNGAPVTHYTALATRVVGSGTASCTTGQQEQSCVLDDLVNGKDYTVTVWAHNSAGRSPSSNSTGPVAPGGAAADGAEVPADVLATPLDSAAVITWTPAAAIAGAPVTGRTATAVGGGGTYTCQSDAGEASSCVIGGLENDTPYTVTVRATAGETDGSDSAPTVVTPRADQRSGQASGVPTPTPDAWEPRETIEIKNSTPSPIDITGYGLWDKNTPGTTDTPDYVFPRGISVPAEGSLRVRSGTATEALPESATLHYTGKTRRFTKKGDRIELANMDRALVHCTTWGGISCRGPRVEAAATQPVGITARNAGRSLVVSWGVPISSGGTAITGYTATAFDEPLGGEVVGSCSASAAGRSCSIDGLTLGTTYYAEVVAENTIGESAPSAPRVQGTQRTAPGAVPDVDVAPRKGGARVFWSTAAANGAAVTSYTAAAYTTGTGGGAVSSCTTDADRRSCTIPGLHIGTPYFIDVTATNSQGAGTPSSPRTPGTPKGLPEAVSTYAKNSVIVRWDAPVEGPSAITGYRARVYTKASGGKRVGTCTATRGATKCRTSWLKKRDEYHIALRVKAGAGSFTFAPRIVTGPARKPSRPRKVSAEVAKARVTIGWAPPNSNGFTPLLRYKARLYSKAADGTVRAECKAGPSKTSCTTDKMPARRYFATVRVKNKLGWSPWTDRVKVVVP